MFNLNENQKSFKKQISYIAKELTPSSKNGLYCQSLMDFANLVCKAKKPLCDKCFFKKICKFDGKTEKTREKAKINKVVLVFLLVKKIIS